MIRRPRFELALERLRPAQWERFEQFASEFLAEEYPDLRTLAAPTGDRGRDAKLWSPTGDESVVFQYSLRDDWRAKLREAAAIVAKNFPDAEVLKYATNQAIGAAGDAVIRDIRREHGLFVDILDRNWFLDRANASLAREAAAESLAMDIADPYLASNQVLSNKAQRLTSGEARAAYVYLALQLEDDTREKGLTKLCFEALVRSALRETDSENRMPRTEIHQKVQEVLPAQDPTVVATYTDNALNRLTKRIIRHWTKEDEYCLTHDERLRIRERLTDVEHQDHAVREVISQALLETCNAMRVEAPATLDPWVDGVRAIVEAMLWKGGESFVASVQRGTIAHTEGKVRNELVREAARDAGIDAGALNQNAYAVLKSAAEQILTEPTETTQSYMRSLADACTLFAFMRETPDVQSAVVKMFSSGEIWLDTSIVLPLFAEELIEDPARRLYTNMVRAAYEAGLKLCITEGVLEEIDSHMRRAGIYARRADGVWEGRIPFLFVAFAFTGQSRGAFGSWIERYRGSQRPQDDIAEYLEDVFGIAVGDLEADAGKAPQELRGAVQEVWHEVHERRRTARDGSVDANTTARLVEHDVENYLGVIGRRKRQRDSGLGYSIWWLTLDRTAFRMRAALRDRLERRMIPDSPVMGPDFMVTYLAIGPLRGRLRKDREADLPVALARMASLEELPTELIELADTVRDETRDMPEHVVRRRVRDTLDSGRRRMGALAEGGMDQVLEDLRRGISGSPEETQ